MISKDIVHYYAGWPGKALCLGVDTPFLTISSTERERVTCSRCKEMLPATTVEQRPSNTLLDEMKQVTEKAVAQVQEIFEEQPPSKHRWAVEPHPYDSSLDVFVCDDDEEALQAALDGVEQKWDSLVPGQECVIKIRCNKERP